MLQINASKRSRIFQKYKPRLWPLVFMVILIMLSVILNTEHVSAATLAFNIKSTENTYTIKVDGKKLFDIDNAINEEVYQNAICFHNSANVAMALQLASVKELTDDTWLYRNSYIRIYDGRGVYYDGKLNNANFQVELPANWDEKIYFDYHYSDPNARVPDNAAMGRTMDCEFTFQVTEVSNLSSGWTDTGDNMRMVWIVILCAVTAILIWRIAEKQKSRQNQKNQNQEIYQEINIMASEEKTVWNQAETARAAVAMDANVIDQIDGTNGTDQGSTMQTSQMAQNANRTASVLPKPKHTVKEIILDIIIVLLIVVTAIAIFVRIRFDSRYVETGSMRPEYAIGSFVLVDDHAYDDADPQVGDVAVYKTGDREIMHRVIEVTGDGQYIFKGDNNNTDDFTPIGKEEIIGKAVWHTNLFAPLVRKIRNLSNV